MHPPAPTFFAAGDTRALLPARARARAARRAGAAPACAVCVLRAGAEKDALRRASTAVLLGVASGYKALVSPLLGRNCRFVPTCSSYLQEAVLAFGPYRGALLFAWRIVRCNPFGGSGFDPPSWPPVPYNAGS